VTAGIWTAILLVISGTAPVSYIPQPPYRTYDQTMTERIFETCVTTQDAPPLAAARPFGIPLPSGVAESVLSSWGARLVERCSAFAPTKASKGGVWFDEGDPPPDRYLRYMFTVPTP
jgi:hypothetical protein